MKKHFFSIFVPAVISMLLPCYVKAQESPVNRVINSGGTAMADAIRAEGVLRVRGLFGIGVVLGEPTGISGKYWLSEKTAIDGAFG